MALFAVVLAVFNYPKYSITKLREQLDSLVVNIKGEKTIELHGVGAITVFEKIIASTEPETGRISQISYLDAYVLDESGKCLATIQVLSQLGVDVEKSLKPLKDAIYSDGDRREFSNSITIPKSDMRIRRRVVDH